MDDEVIILDEYEDYPRDAVVVRRGGRDHRPGGGYGGGYGTGPGRPHYPRHPVPVRPVQPMQPVAVAQPVEPEKKKKEISDWAPDILRGLAALMPMPAAPVAETDVGDNVKNLITYFGALQLVAQRKEQIYALASIAERHL